MAELRVDALTASQERMKREVGAFFEDVSRARPLVLFLDDLHWADVSTIDILNYLAGRFADMRVLVLATYRPAEMALAQHPFLGIASDLRSRGLFEEIALGFLAPADVDRYLALEFPEHRFPADFSALIHAKTEGSPLFMADLVRYLRDSGRIVDDRRRVGPGAVDVGPAARPARIGAQHDRAQDRAARRAGPRAAAGGQRAGARVRFGHRRRSARDGSGRRRGAAGRARARARVRQARRRARVSGPDADAALQLRARAVSERALRLAAADAPRGAQRPRGASRSSRTASRRPRAPRRLAVLFEAARDFATQRAVTTSWPRSTRSACIRLPRGAVAGRTRAEGAARAARRSRADAAGARPADDPRPGAADDEGLGRARARAGVRARARALPRCSTTRPKCFPCSGR